MTKMLPLLLCVGSITMSMAGKSARRTSERRAQAGNGWRRCRKKGKLGLSVSIWAPSVAWEGFSGCGVCAPGPSSPGPVLEQQMTPVQGSDRWFPKQPET